MRKPLSGNANAYTPIRTACLAAYCCYAAKKITRSEAANERQVRLLAPKFNCEPFSPSSTARPVSVAHLARSLGPPRTYSTSHSMRMLAVRAPTLVCRFMLSGLRLLSSRDHTNAYLPIRTACLAASFCFSAKKTLVLSVTSGQCLALI